MTEKDLKKLNRYQLLELLIIQTERADKLQVKLDAAETQLANQELQISSLGSIAEASLQLKGVFQAAQDACQQYTENVQSRSENLEQHCRQMEQETQARCEAMIAQAKAQAQAYLEEAKQKQTEQEDAYLWLTELMDGSDTK